MADERDDRRRPLGSASQPHMTAAALAPTPAADDVVVRCQHGDRRAFDELYLAYRRQVAAQLYRLIGPIDLDDSVQEVFFEVWRSIGRFRAQSKLST